MNGTIHEMDLNSRISGRPDEKLLALILDLCADLTCIDSSIEERCATARRGYDYIESKLGAAVHWMGMACHEGECDKCKARPEFQG